MKIECLASSSGGNCYLIDDGKTKLLLEGGIPLKEIVRKLNQYSLKLTDLEGCIISHGHDDHSKAIGELARFMTVYASEDTLRKKGIIKFDEIEQKDKTLGKCHILISETKITVKGYNIISFATEHDCEGSLDFIIQSTATKESLLFMTDTKWIKYDLSSFKFDYIMIECNYVDELLETQEINPSLKKRLLNSHMSLTTCIKTLKSFDLKETKEIYLIHLSDERSDENKMKTEVAKATGKVVYVCGKNGGIK